MKASTVFFPRGNGPLVSFLIPTRGRPWHLREAIETIWEKRETRNEVEFLLGIDDDDTATLSEADWLQERYGEKVVKKCVGPRGRGYRDHHLRVNRLCEESTGDWLLLFADDAKMLTQGWDSMIWRLTAWNKPVRIQDVCLLLLSQAGSANSYSFVALRKKAYDILGVFSVWPHCDLWIFQVMQAIDMVVPCEVVVQHDNIEDDQTGIEAISSVCDVWKQMKTPQEVNQRLKFAKKLLDWIQPPLLTWQGFPEQTGWYWWKKDHEDLERPMFVFLKNGILSINQQERAVEKGMAIGPDFGSDQKPKVFSISEIGGLWSVIA